MLLVLLEHLALKVSRANLETKDLKDQRVNLAHKDQTVQRVLKGKMGNKGRQDTLVLPGLKANLVPPVVTESMGLLVIKEYPAQMVMLVPKDRRVRTARKGPKDPLVLMERSEIPAPRVTRVNQGTQDIKASQVMLVSEEGKAKRASQGLKDLLVNQVLRVLKGLKVSQAVMGLTD